MPRFEGIADLLQRDRTVWMQLGEGPERELRVALRGALIVGLGEALAGDQLVLEFSGVAVSERVPSLGTVEAPDPQRPAGAAGSVAQGAGEGGRALQIDRHHRQSAFDPIGEDREQRRRLARAAGTENQPVSRQLRVREPHGPAATSLVT